MVDSLKDLKKLIVLCRAQGVDSIKLNGVELTLGALPAKALKEVTRKTLPTAVFAPGGITADTRIDTEELTPDQLLFYSSPDLGTHEGN